MNTRLKQFLSAENISQAQFADTINVVRASVSHVLAGRNNPSYDFIKAIMDNYPNLNIEWLILGKGKMYKERSSAPEPEQTQATIEDYSDDLLFPVIDEEVLTDTHQIPSSETENPSQLTGSIPNIAVSSDINTANSTAQQVVRQRKVSKIVVLFDDGSFQEL
jgi:transcriptional regulator with XRE-family HTH domain